MDVPSDEPDLGSYIRQLRQTAGISQRTLAGQVGIDVTYLSKLENGRQGASQHVLRSLAEALNVPVPRMLMLAGRVPEDLRAAIVARANEEAKLMLATEPRSASRLLVPPRYLTSFMNRTGGAVSPPGGVASRGRHHGRRLTRLRQEPVRGRGAEPLRR
jgi:transcriptional regulator with XRE-family HTH domain